MVHPESVFTIQDLSAWFSWLITARITSTRNGGWTISVHKSRSICVQLLFYLIQKLYNAIYLSIIIESLSSGVGRKKGKGKNLDIPFRRGKGKRNARAKE